MTRLMCLLGLHRWRVIADTGSPHYAPRREQCRRCLKVRAVRVQRWSR